MGETNGCTSCVRARQTYTQNHRKLHIETKWMNRSGVTESHKNTPIAAIEKDAKNKSAKTCTEKALLSNLFGKRPSYNEIKADGERTGEIDSERGREKERKSE